MKHKIYLCDFTYYNPYTLTRISIPLNIGYIAAYLHKTFHKECEISLFKNPEVFLASARSSPPDMVGLSCYHWNMRLDVLTAKCIKNMNPGCITVVGGPSIDMTKEEQLKLFAFFDGALDFIVVNDGEEGFSNIVSRALCKSSKEVFDIPVDGCAFVVENNELIAGKDMGLSLDLDSVPSPILTGVLDDFLTSDFIPLLHTSRGCPYSCAFCAHGKLKEKIRMFSEEVVKEEIIYIAKKYKEHPHKTLIVTDDNFGINKRDLNIARYLVETKKRFGFPQQIHTYFDIKFSPTVKETARLIAGMNFGGVQLGFQSFNHRTLKAVGRKGITEEKLDNIIRWSKRNDFPISGDLIYGLPYETKKSFLDSLEYVIQKKIDHIMVMNLQIMPGTMLSWRSLRKQFGLVTKYRPLFSNDFGVIGGKFVCESQEVVVASKDTSFDDFMETRKIMLFVYAVWGIGYFKKIFDYLVSINCKIVPILQKIIDPSLYIGGDYLDEYDFKNYETFLCDFDNSARSELYESHEDLYDDLKNMYATEKNAVREPTRLNVYFSSKLIYKETNWFGKILSGILENENLSVIDREILDDLIKISTDEWINVDEPHKIRELTVSGETLNFLNIGNKNTSYPQSLLEMKPSGSQIRRIASYARNMPTRDLSFYYNILDNIIPRSSLRYEIFLERPI